MGKMDREELLRVIRDSADDLKVWLEHADMPKVFKDRTHHVREGKGHILTLNISLSWLNDDDGDIFPELCLVNASLGMLEMSRHKLNGKWSDWNLVDYGEDRVGPASAELAGYGTLPEFEEEE